MRISKEQGIPAFLGGIASTLPVLAIVWFVVQPFIKQSVSIALADDVHQSVQKEVAPIKGGLSVIIQSNIVRLKKEIAQLQRVQAADPQKWSADQADLLVDKLNELDAQQMALAALK